MIPLTIFAATGKRGSIKVFGDDYNTPDGTCLRDYIHVDDLCRAHIAAFKNLEVPSSCSFYNLGTGTPNSVMEIIKGVEEVTGLKVPYEISARREGDPDALYANSAKAKSELGWKIKFNDVREIIETAWRWHKNNPNGFPKD